MEWCRLGTGYYLDGAILRAGEAAEVLFLRCIAYSGAQETRGRVPKHVLPMLAPTRTGARLKALVAEGLLIEDGHDVLIRSWSRWQEALDTESERRRKDRERKARDRASRKSEDASLDSSVDAARIVHMESARKEVEGEEKTPTVSQSRKRATPKTGPPDTIEITPVMAAWGREHCPLITDPHGETIRFLDHARANGKVFTDWTAAWRTWMSNAQKWAVRDGVRPLNGERRPEPAWMRG